MAHRAHTNSALTPEQQGLCEGRKKEDAETAAGQWGWGTAARVIHSGAWPHASTRLRLPDDTGGEGCPPPS